MRAGASLLATLLGAVLLLADGLHPCDSRGGYKGSFSFTSSCSGPATTGRVDFDWHESDGFGDAPRYALTQLSNAGLRATKASVNWSEGCSESDEDVPLTVDFSFRTAEGETYDCKSIKLRAEAQHTVTCGPASASPQGTGGTTVDGQGAGGNGSTMTCVIVFEPAE